MQNKTHNKVVKALQRLFVACVLVGAAHLTLAQAPQVVVPAVGALSALPQSSAIYPSGPNALSEGSINPSPALKFRDPSKALTLGEISDMQAQKVNSDILRKFGFTDIEPIRPKPVAVTQVKTVTSITTLAIWGKQENLRAEIMVNGVLHRVTGHEAVAPNLRVLRVRASGVELEYDRPLAPQKTKSSRGTASALGKETVTQRVSVGQSLEIPL